MIVWLFMIGGCVGVCVCIYLCFRKKSTPQVYYTAPQQQSAVQPIPQYPTPQPQSYGQPLHQSYPQPQQQSYPSAQPQVYQSGPPPPQQPIYPSAQGQTHSAPPRQLSSGETPSGDYNTSINVTPRQSQSDHPSPPLYGPEA